MPNYTYLISLIGYILGTALFIGLFFVSIGNYMLSKKPTHILECMMCVVLGLMSFIRFCGTLVPPIIIGPNVIVGTSLLWLLFCILAITWSVILASQRWREITGKRSSTKIVEKVEK